MVHTHASCIVHVRCGCRGFPMGFLRLRPAGTPGSGVGVGAQVGAGVFQG